jgi:hypothetical protein
VLHEDRYTFLITCGSVLHIMGNVSHKSCKRHQNTHFMLNNLFPKIMPLMGCGKIPQSRKGIPCWTYKSTNMHSANVTLIAFPLQKWLYERASLSRYKHRWLSFFNYRTSNYSRNRYGAYDSLNNELLGDIWHHQGVQR